MDSLALKLMEDAADGPVDIDDDPDVDDWGEMYADEGSDDDVSDSSDVEQAIVNDDISMDSDDDENVQDQDDFMDADDSDDSDGREPADDDDESNHGKDLIFTDDDESSDDQPSSRKKARKTDALPTFADADEYADVVEKHFQAPLGKSNVKATYEEGVGDSDAKPTKKRNKRRSRS